MCIRDSPGIANTAEEALKMLRAWRAAQKGGQEVGIPALGGNERFILLSLIHISEPTRLDVI
eukprot:6475843-Prorocentrum_lima.AAC.1